MWSALTSWFSAIFLLTAAIFVALISQVILVSAGSNYMLFTVGLLLFSIAVSGFSRSVFFRFKFIKKLFSFKGVLWITLGGLEKYPIGTALESLTSAISSIGKVF